MLNGFKKWWNKQQEISDGFLKRAEERNNKAEIKAREKAEKYLQKFLTAEGTEKAQAKQVLMAHMLAYPTHKIDYVGGHYKVPTGQNNVWAMLIPQGIIMENVEDLIPYGEIKGISFKSQEEVQRDVTLTRLIAFGVYAFALKKEKRKVKDYLILDCEKEGIKYSIAFAGDGVNNLYKDLFEKIAG